MMHYHIQNILPARYWINKGNMLKYGFTIHKWKGYKYAPNWTQSEIFLGTFKD